MKHLTSFSISLSSALLVGIDRPATWSPSALFNKMKKSQRIIKEPNLASFPRYRHRLNNNMSQNQSAIYNLFDKLKLFSIN